MERFIAMMRAMRRDARRAWLLASIFVLMLTGAASAQDARYVWSGVKIEEGKTVGTRVDSQDRKVWEAEHAKGHAERYRKELAEIQLLIEVNRNFDEALKRIEDLHVRAAWALDYDERMTVLAEIASRRAELLAKLGRREDALRATNALLLDESDKQAAKGYEIVPADAKAIESEKQAVESKALIDLRERLSPAGGDRADATPANAIEATVFNAINSDAPQIVLDIGPRAAPALEKLVLQDPDRLPSRMENDPLRLLLELSKMRGAQLILDNYDKGSFFWHKRILRAMNACNVLEGPGTWQNALDQNTPPRLLEPIWVAILSRLLEDSLIGREAMHLVTSVAKRDALSSKLQVALSRALASEDVDLQKQAVQVLVEAAGRETVKPVLESALDHADANIRHFAAERLLDYLVSDGLVAHVDSPDPEVRVQLARSMRQHMSTYCQYSGSSCTGNGTRGIVPVPDERARGALARLCRDADASVRLEAARSSVELRPPLDASIYAALAGDSDTSVRKIIAGWRDDRLSAATCLPAYAVLASDSDPSVLSQFDASFARACSQESFQDEDERLLELLKKRHESRSIAIDPQNALYIYQRLLRSPAGVRTILRWALDEKDDKLLEMAVLRMPAPVSGTNAINENSSVWTPDVIDDSTVERIYRRIHAISPEAFKSFQSRLVDLNRAGRGRVAALLPIVNDKTADRGLRVSAASLVAAARTGDVVAVLSALLLDPCWSEGEPTPDELQTLLYVGNVILPKDQDELAVVLAKTQRVPDVVALAVLHGISQNRGFPDQAVRPILDRWFARPTSSRRVADYAQEVVRRVLLSIPNERDEALSKYLIDALGDQYLRLDAIRQMASLRWPEFLDILGERLLKDPRHTDGVVPAIAGYMNDQAAKYLLQAAGATADEDMRKACFEGLESIRKYQDETARWNLRKSGQRARDEAVQQLVPMLDDSDPTTRAQAARSLATLEAVEYLPRIVKMLKDPAPEVRDAAKKALDALNALSAKKP